MGFIIIGNILTCLKELDAASKNKVKVNAVIKM